MGACCYAHQYHTKTRPSHVKVIDSIVIGATVGWGATLEREFKFEYHCTKCDAHYFKGPRLIFGDKQRHPEMWDNEGFPIDETGKRLPIID